MKIALRKLTVFTIFFSFFSADSFSQDQSNDEINGGKYLRIANLLPITHGKITIKRGQDLFLSGAKAGFFRNYDIVQEDGGSEFTVELNGKKLGQFRLQSQSNPAFFTLVIALQNGQEVIKLNEDNPLVENEINGVTVLHKHFCAYLGGYSFPYRVNAGELGSWVVDGESLILDIPVEGSPPETISVEFESKYGDPVTLHFPIDFATYDRNSLFINQRGVNRPRIFAYPDNQLPLKDPLDPESPENNPAVEE